MLVHRLAYNGDVVAFKMGRRQGGVGEASSLLLLPKRAKRGRFAYDALPAAHFERNDITSICLDGALAALVVLEGSSNQDFYSFSVAISVFLGILVPTLGSRYNGGQAGCVGNSARAQ